MFIHVVTVMQNVLNQIVPSLVCVEFQYCLKNQQLQHQHHLLVVSCAIIALPVRKYGMCLCHLKHYRFSTHCARPHHYCTAQHALKRIQPRTTE